MNHKFYVGLIAILSISIIGILVYGLFFASDPKEIPSALILKKAKPFTFTTFNGQVLFLEQFRGKPIILNFWASWCVACRQEAPILEAAHQKFTPQGAVFIGIAINDKREDSLRFIQKHEKTYYLAPDDSSGRISLDYGVSAVPESFFIDRDGIIQHKQLGIVTKKLVEDFLVNQLQTKTKESKL